MERVVTAKKIKNHFIRRSLCLYMSFDENDRAKRQKVRNCER